jgi:hypothetical protein
MRYSVYNHVNRATELRPWSRSGVVKSSGSYAPVESILNRTDSMRAVTIRREDVERESDRSRSLLLSIHAEASSARRALTSLPDSDLLPISVSLSHFPRADKCDVTILQPSRAVGWATLSSLHATRVAACLRRWTLIPCHLPLPQGSNGRRALGALSATTPVVDAIRRSRQITPDHARSCQITSDRLYSPFTTAATSAAPPARRARARGAPRTPHRT